MGLRLNQYSVREIFVRLSRAIGIRTHLARFGHGPRLHDLRQNAESRKMPNQVVLKPYFSASFSRL